MKKYASLVISTLVAGSLAASMPARAVVGWVNEIHNQSGDEFYVSTTGDNDHRGEVQEKSIHCGKRVDKKYSNWQSGVYRVCNGDQLFMHQMGIPWYRGGGRYLTIWNATKHGKSEPMDDTKKLRIFIGGCGGGKDCMRFQIAGVDLQKKSKATIGKQGAADVIEFSMRFDKVNGITFTSQSENSGTVKAVEAVTRFVWENRDEIAKALGIAIGAAASAAGG